MKILIKTKARPEGMTLLELLIVISIIGLLAAILVPSMGAMLDLAMSQKLTQHVKQIASATTVFGAENGGRLPSPEYPGGMNVPSGKTAEEYFPKHWDFTGSGLWLDGVVFAEVYLQEGNGANYAGGDNGEHLKGTIFENTKSVKEDPLEMNWHRHSYAMNANLQYDRIYDNVDSSDPYLTEKTLSNLLFAPNAMLIIECTEPNVVMYNDREAIIQTASEHWGKNGKAITAFLDGHAERLRPNDIPAGDPEKDPAASKFWRGVDAER